MKFGISLLSLIAATGMTAVTGEFGDYADHSFECPALTTCAQVCVASVSDCPLAMTCNATQTLCADGTCADGVCEGHQLESPCAFACAPVACPKVDDFYDTCQEKYAELYAFEEECGALEIEESTHKYTLKEPAFIIGYVWISASVFFVLAWCAFNQRLSPVSGSTQPFSPGETKGNNVMEKNSWQTGYKVHPVGAAINVFTILTLLAIQAMLMWLTIQYYVQQEAIPSLTMYFPDEEQVLMVFEIVWDE